ncbi:DUF2780 domain-containing protein [Pseudaminobacter sp. 19-2017]|uniref:DUF2780 domain-containing protein n=2 Tax=Pseudaminobacter soli (ex Zhang et al. 2022) TaxID=2831468 RepID=A0A942DWQ2_9HYPH|nr:DUF2780 domain-containing protein [Pseudaminobacter soli]
MQIQDIVTNISNQVGIDPSTAEKAVGILLSVFKHEADGTRVGELFAAIPGADDLATRYDVMAEDTQQSAGGLAGLLSSALGSLLGSRAGALIQGVAQLQAAGLDIPQIRQTGASFVEQAKQASNPQLVDDIVESVPGLKGHFGL